MDVEDLHRWDVDFEEARRIQEELRERLVLSSNRNEVTLVAGADVSYSIEDKDTLLAAVVVMTLRCLSRYRLPEPTRMAHNLTRKTRAGELSV